MPDTFRLRVLKELTSALAEITPARGYQHDLTGAVFRGRLVYEDRDPLPMLSVVEPPEFPETMTSRGASVAKTPLLVLVQGFVADDKANPTDPAYNLLGDVQKRLSAEMVRIGHDGAFGLGNRIDSLELGTGVVRPPDADISSRTAYFWLPVRMTLFEDLSNPFM